MHNFLWLFCTPSGFHWFRSCVHVLKSKCGAYYVYREGWFKHEVCAKVKSWHPLTFVVDIKVNSSAHNATGKISTRDYHSVLKVIFQIVAAVQSACAFHHTLCIDDSYFDVKVKYPIAVIIGDAKRNNSLPVLIFTPHGQNNFVVRVTYYLRKQMIHIFCVIMSLNREFSMWLWNEIGKEFKASPSNTLRMHSGTSPLVPMGMVSTSIVLQKNCISSRKALLYLFLKDWLINLVGNRMLLLSLTHFSKKCKSITIIRVIATFCAWIFLLDSPTLAKLLVTRRKGF